MVGIKGPRVGFLKEWPGDPGLGLLEEWPVDPGMGHVKEWPGDPRLFKIEAPSVGSHSLNYSFEGGNSD